MIATEFVKAYPYDLAEAQIHAGEHSKGIEDAQDYSYQFGRLLHTSLRGAEADSELTTPEAFRSYAQWKEENEERDFALLGALADVDPEKNIRAFMELNFHRMNAVMLGMWEPIIKGQWSSEGNRKHRILASQRAIALEGFAYYGARQKLVERHGSHALYESGNIFKQIGRLVNGVVQEMDTAIVLLELVRRHPGWTIVPAPLNFERTIKGTNVDHLIIDCERQRAVGVQVKTAAKEWDIEASDQGRVVFIDGRTDLDNVIAHKTDKRSSSSKTVAWAGIISTKMVSEMPISKKGHAGLRNTPVKRHLATSLVGNLRVNLNGIVDRIEPRILHKL